MLRLWVILLKGVHKLPFYLLFIWQIFMKNDIRHMCYKNIVIYQFH